MADTSTASVVPRKRKPFSWVSSYNPAGAGMRGRILDETGDRTSEFADMGGTYIGDETDRTAEFSNPNLATTANVPNPLYGGASANSVQANMDAAQRTAAGNLRSAGGVGTVAHTVVPGSNLTPVGDIAVDRGGVTRFPVNPATGEESAMRGVMDQNRDMWLARGGSDRTMHRAQVAEGIRPAIDARTVRSPGEAPSAASIAAMRGFGDEGPGQEGHSPWTPTTFGNAGSAIWDQMSQRFDSARAKLRAKLNGGTNNIAQMPEGEGYLWPPGQFTGVPDYAPQSSSSVATVVPNSTDSE